jgi:hypothetical protein
LHSRIFSLPGHAGVKTEKELNEALRLDFPQSRNLCSVDRAHQNTFAVHPQSPSVLVFFLFYVASVLLSTHQLILRHTILNRSSCSIEPRTLLQRTHFKMNAPDRYALSSFLSIFLVWRLWAGATCDLSIYDATTTLANMANTGATVTTSIWRKRTSVTCGTVCGMWRTALD